MIYNILQLYSNETKYTNYLGGAAGGCEDDIVAFTKFSNCFC